MDTSRTLRLSLLAALATSPVLGGCAHEYYYQPAERDLVSVQGTAGARYLVPPERPDGELRVATFGMQDLRPTAGGATMPAFHVRLVVSNNGDATPWTMDTRQVLIDIAGEGSSPAVYVNSDVGSLPVVTIARGEQRVVDFFFPLPGSMQREAAIPRFDVKWQVTTSERLVAGRTPFERFDGQLAPPPGPRVAVAFGWGPFWWFDPFYPRGAVFVHPGPFIVIPRHPHHVYVTPRGRRVYR
jgi:hypothetical protein